MINLPIEIGDVLLAGRFKNKRITVKEITFDENGLPLVNGRGILKVRIAKLMPKKEIAEMNRTELVKDDQYVYNQIGNDKVKYTGKSSDQIHHIFKFVDKAGTIKLTPKDVQKFIIKENTMKENKVKKVLKSIIKEILMESTSNPKELRAFILANRNKIEHEYEMDGTTDFIKSKFPDADDDMIEQLLNDTLGI